MKIINETVEAKMRKLNLGLVSSRRWRKKVTCTITCVIAKAIRKGKRKFREINPLAAVK
jgi:hypothetical protein